MIEQIFENLHRKIWRPSLLQRNLQSRIINPSWADTEGVASCHEIHKRGTEYDE